MSVEDKKILTAEDPGTGGSEEYLRAAAEEMRPSAEEYGSERTAAVKYADIIDLPHHVSDRHPQMPRQDRAAQFAPFAALTGLDEAMEGTARRVTDDYLRDDVEEIDDI